MPVPVLLKAAFGASLAITVSEAVPNFHVEASCRATAKLNAAIDLAVSQTADACIRDEEARCGYLFRRVHCYAAPRVGPGPAGNYCAFRLVLLAPRSGVLSASASCVNCRQTRTST